MPVTLAGTMYSPAYQNAAFVCKELDIPFENAIVDFTKGDNYLPQNLACQPFAQVPYLLDNEDGEPFILYESRAIGRYLAVKFAKEGQPRLIWDWKEEGMKKAGKFEQAASVELNNWQQYAFGVAWEAIWNANGNMAIRDAHLAMLEKRLNVLDKILEKQRYMAGDDLSLVDFWYIPLANILKEGGYPIMEVENRPHVLRWWREMTSRPSWLEMKKLIQAYLDERATDSR